MTETEIQIANKGRAYFYVLGPPLALLMFAQAMTGSVLTDLIVYRTCLVTLNISNVKCFLLRTNASDAEARQLETEVEPYTNILVMVKSLMESVVPAILSLFLGPWSDRGGRRPLLLAGYTGFTLMFSAFSLMCNWNISPWFLLIPSIPAYFLGGFTTIIIGSICFISDTTVEKDRTMLLAWLQASILCGIVLGLFVGPFVFNKCGYTIVFSTSAICSILALIYTYVLVPETVKDTSQGSMCQLFKISFVRELVDAVLLKREGFYRPVVWLAIYIVITWTMVLEAEVSIGFLFARERLGWDVLQYSYFSGSNVILNIAGVLCGVSLLSRVFGFSDTLVAVIALISALGGALTRSLAYRGWHMYLGGCIGMFNGAVGPVMRSILSKSVPAKDIGKLFSLTSSLETLSPLAGAPLYTQVYFNYLPPIYPSPVYLISASFYAMSLLSTIYIEVLLRKIPTANFVPLVEEN